MPTIRVYSRTGDKSSYEVKQLLRESGHTFTDYDVDKEPSMREEAVKLTDGKERFPVVVVDDKAFYGKALMRALRNALGIKTGFAAVKERLEKLKKGLSEEFPKVLGPKKSWDYLEPKSIEIGVTSGLASIDRKTLVQEAMDSIGKGCDLLRLDVENHNHLTPKDKEDLKALAEGQGMKWAIHADLYIDMSMSEKTHWEYTDHSLKEYVKISKDIKAVYVNIHASIQETPALRPAVSRAYEVHVDPDGEKITELFKSTPDAQNWYVEEQMRGVGHEQKMRALQVEWQWEPELTTEDLKKRISELKRNAEEIDKRFKAMMLKDIMKEFDGRVTEWVTYNIVAWSMYKKGDPIWRAICGEKSPKDLIEKGSQDDLIKLVDAVAGSYVRGHFRRILGKMEKDRVMFVLENPDARGGQWKGQKQHRLMHPTNIYHVVKAIGSPLVMLSIDWEHMAMQGYNPWDEAKKFPSDIGEYTLNFDVNSHANVNHLQHPVERGDVHLYKLLWEVKKRGLGKCYLMYEWGGGRQPDQRWQESVPALKMLAKMLENDVHPDDLPPEFFGLGPAEQELEKRIMERNMFKSIEGTLEFPELAHGWFSGEILKKSPRKLETWAKEEYR